MAKIPDEIIEKIQESTDIVEIISSHFPLKRAGRNFKALCPFHQEKTPSFIVSPDKQIFHCFGCNAGGNVFSFLMKYEQIDFLEAVQMLAKRAGIELPSKKEEVSREISDTRELMYKINQLACEYYHYVLLKTKQGYLALAYLKKRGLNHETISRFKLGFAPAGGSSLVEIFKKRGLDLNLACRLGLLVQKQDGTYFDRFRGRIIFLISDSKGRPAGFGARVLGESLPKYINSPDSEIFKKGRLLYCLNLSAPYLRQKDLCVVVEGYLDAITPFQAGIKNIVSTLGTALTIEQIRLLGRFTKNIIVVYDADQAGQEASLRNLDLLLQEGLNVKLVKLPEGFDPDSLVRTQGLKGFQEKLDGACDIFDYKSKFLMSRYSPRLLDDKIKIIEEMLSTIAKVPNAVLQSAYLEKLSQVLSVPREALVSEFKKIKSGRPADLNGDARFSPTSHFDSPVEKMLLRLILEDISLISELKERLDITNFRNPAVKKAIEALFELASTGPLLTPSKLLNRLKDEPTAGLITQILADDQLTADKRRIFDECINRIKREKVKNRLRELQAQIQTAEDNQNKTEAFKLIVEYNSLLKKEA
jgi:DNA primase